MNETMLDTLVLQGIEMLAQDDPELYQLLEAEYDRQNNTLVMVASSSIVDPSVLACMGSVPVNVTAEGYPAKRYHSGCAVIDRIEQLAIDRAKAVFHAQYANVQPHSASTANYIVMTSLLKPGDTILGMELQYGGHLTHGSKASLSGQYFNAIGYGLDPTGVIDYDQVARLAHQHQPALIICGTTSYPRVIDFQRFRAIADAVDAYLLADISHISALVIAGLHPSPIDHAHFTTTCTHKQLYGPRGGLILIGRDHTALGPDGKRTLAELMQRGVFPFLQGAPIMNVIAAKARTLANAQQPAFRALAERIMTNAAALAQSFSARGYRVVSGGTSNHLVILDVTTHGLTGSVAERALEESGIIVNKNRIPGDTLPAMVTSGIRLGTNTLAYRGMGVDEMARCAELADRVLQATAVGDGPGYVLDATVREAVRAEVRALCERFPIPAYPRL